MVCVTLAAGVGLCCPCGFAALVAILPWQPCCHGGVATPLLPWYHFADETFENVFKILLKLLNVRIVKIPSTFYSQDHYFTRHRYALLVQFSSIFKNQMTRLYSLYDNVWYLDVENKLWLKMLCWFDIGSRSWSKCFWSCFPWNRKHVLWKRKVYLNFEQKGDMQ